MYSSPIWFGWSFLRLKFIPHIKRKRSLWQLCQKDCLEYRHMYIHVHVQCRWAHVHVQQTMYLLAMYHTFLSFQMREIELCPGCYELTVKQPKDWFCTPCVS